MAPFGCQLYTDSVCHFACNCVCVWPLIHGPNNVPLCNIDSCFSLPQLVGMEFRPCRSSGCLGPPLLAHKRCLKHIKCLTRREGLWSPLTCRHCDRHIAAFRADPSGPSTLRGIWTLVRNYIKYEAKQSPRVLGPDLQAVLEPSAVSKPERPGPSDTRRMHAGSGSPKTTSPVTTSGRDPFSPAPATFPQGAASPSSTLQPEATPRGSRSHSSKRSRSSSRASSSKSSTRSTSGSSPQP